MKGSNVNHAGVKRHLTDYLEGDLELEDRAIVDAHLDQCHSCSLEVEEMLQTIRLLRNLPEPEIPPMIAANVMRRIRAGESRPGFFARMRRAVGSILEPTFVLPASAIAVAALVVTVTQGPQTIFLGQGETQISSSGRQSAVANLPLLTSSTSPVSTAGSLLSRNVVLGRNAILGRDAQLSSNAHPYRGNDWGSQTVSRRVRIRMDGSGVARLSMSRSAPISAQVPSVRLVSAPVFFTSEVPEAWAAQFSRVMYARPSSLSGDDRMGQTGLMASAQPFGGASRGWVQSVALTQPASSDGIFADLDRDEADPRDAWLALGFEDPIEFADYIAGRNLAEQELWAARLSDRAVSRGLMDDLLRALRESGDSTASWIADDFEAHAARAVSRSSVDSSGEPTRPILR
jgi:hypothetical protein